MEYVLVNGYLVKNLTTENTKILDLLLSNNLEQSDIFAYQHLLNSSNENLAVIGYRQWRVGQRNLGLEEFLSLYLRNEKDALREMFMYPIAEQEFRILTNKIKCGKITIQKLFDKHKEEPFFRLLRLLM
jgi:hypothetical protein